MKRNYQKPSLLIVQVAIYQHLLTVSGDIDGEATKPAKGRGTNFEDEDEERGKPKVWAEEDIEDDDVY